MTKDFKIGDRVIYFQRKKASWLSTIAKHNATIIRLGKEKVTIEFNGIRRAVNPDDLEINR